MTIKNYYSLSMPEIDLPNLNEREMIGDALRIKSTSSKESRLAILKIATFFKREFHFDCTQYATFYDLEDDNECFAYLWTIEKKSTPMKSVVVGGFCFRLREWGGYGLQWIWIHPYLRNMGLLKRHWDLFEEKFGKNFYCEPPLSLGMESFLSKKDNSLHLEQKEKRNPGTWLNNKNK